MLRLSLLSLLTLALASCSTPKTRGLRLVNDRAAKLKPLSTYPPSWCRVDAHLTQPAIARYRQMFPKEVDVLTAESLPYTWKATETSCEVTPLKLSPLTANYQGFLETALCLLVQTHFVNSPFDGLALGPERVEPREARTLLRTGDAADLGIYLDPQRFTVETRTHARGILNAEYQNLDGRWLPTRLAQRLGATLVELGAFEYPPASSAHPRTIRSFTIGVGEERALPHSHVSVSECQSY